MRPAVGGSPWLRRDVVREDDEDDDDDDDDDDFPEAKSEAASWSG